jgi:hypothetical protein
MIKSHASTGIASVLLGAYPYREILKRFAAFVRVTDGLG